MRVLLVGHWMENVERAFLTRGHTVVPINPDHLLSGEVTMRVASSCDLVIAFPPCKYLCSSGLHWNTRRPDRSALTEQALNVVQQILAAPCDRIALENPVGCISSRVRKPDQIIQPYDFGHDASKRTCLWLKNLPLLRPTRHVEPRMVNGKPRWGNQFDSGQNNQVNASDRTRVRAERWQGVCNAMAEQWTC